MKRSRRPFGRVFTRGTRGFYVRFRWHGREWERSAGPNRSGAERKLAQAHAALSAGAPLEDVLADLFGDPRGSRLTFRDAAALYLEQAKQRKRESTWAVDVTRLRVLLQAPLAGKYLSEIGADEFERWKQEHLAAGLAVSSINRYLALASAVYRWAERMRHVDENPLRRVERFNEAGRERNEFLTSQEVGALIEAASPVLRPVRIAAFHTGARINALLALTWEDVIFERDVIRFRAASDKANRTREVPLTDGLRSTLVDLHRSRRVGGPDRVFLGEQGRPVSVHVLREHFNRAIAACDAIPQEKKARIKQERVKFHLGRRTAATMLVSSGVSIFDTSMTLGISTVSVTAKHYAKFAPTAARAAMDKLGSALAPPAPTEGSGAV